MAKILIVDDQKAVLLTLEGILTQKRHTVVAVSSAYDALEKLNGQKFDLVITDAVMPGGKSGFELTRMVRADAKLANLPVIILTGKRERSDIQRGIESGANDYIIKPVDPEILMAKVNSILTKKGAAENTFLDCKIQVKASIEDDTEISSLSEVGMTLHSNVGVAVGSRIKIATDLFENLGIQNPTLRVVSCLETSRETRRFTWVVQFVGLSEKEFQPIRLFVTSARRNSAA